MTEKELRDIIAIDESHRIERTVSTGNMDKFQEAICAFANGNLTCNLTCNLTYNPPCRI